MKRLFILAVIIISPGLTLLAQNNIIPAKYALKHTGRQVVICDKVFASERTSAQTVLYLGDDSPKQLLTVIIKDSDIAKFKGHPETDFKGKDVCVSGMVTNNKGKAEIIVADPKQIKPYLVDNPVQPKKAVDKR